MPSCKPFFIGTGLEYDESIGNAAGFLKNGNSETTKLYRAIEQGAETIMIDVIYEVEREGLMPGKGSQGKAGFLPDIGPVLRKIWKVVDKQYIESTVSQEEGQS